MVNKSVTIVVPVYGDWPSLKECIDSLKLHVDGAKHRVLLANDCGPDADMIEANIKKSIQGEDNFFYYRNPKNLGFIGNCNRAVMELDKTDNDVLLLNSDTKVTPGFLEEMLQVLYESGKHGAVSPRSNNATIATIPISAIRQKGIEPQKSYEIFKKMKPRMPRYTIVPTAHGFCMLIRRSLIKQFGLFDPVFGKGYGEEVDFCQRIAKEGYICLLSNWSYVFHLEARSFSLETKAKLLEENNLIIRKRYPDYQKQVRDYIEETITREVGIEEGVGLKTQLNAGSAIRRLLDKNKYIYKLSRNIYRRIRK